MNEEQIMALSRAYVMAVERRDFVEILTAKEALQTAITGLVQERDALKSSNESYITLANTAYEIADQRTVERDALSAENTNIKTVMMAAAVEITEHWEAHCDSEGDGPCNLVRRLEHGYPAQYGYDAQTLVRMKQQCDKLAAENKTLKQEIYEIRGHNRETSGE